MQAGAIDGHIDVALVVTWAFLLFFVGLVLYLRNEDRREGYPLRDPAVRGRPDTTFTGPKTYRLLEGGEATTPHDFPPPPMHTTAPEFATGNRLSPTGDPLLSAVGPAAYVMRAETPFLNGAREPETQPLRRATDWSVVPGDTDPRGMAVFDEHGHHVGRVTDLWVDQEVRILRYLEVALDDPARAVLVPIYATTVRERRREVRVRDLLAEQFAGVPVLARPDQITAREEDQVNAYFAGGAFFNRAGKVR